MKNDKYKLFLFIFHTISSYSIRLVNSEKIEESRCNPFRFVRRYVLSMTYDNKLLLWVVWEYYHFSHVIFCATVVCLVYDTVEDLKEDESSHVLPFT